MESRHLSEFIDRPVGQVYEFVADPANLPQWAAGIASGIEQVDGRWWSDSPMGRVEIRFVEPNALGVLDHYVTVPSGETFYNPLRVIADDERSELVFTVRRRPDMSDSEFDADVEAVATDLATLKRLLESD